MRTALQHRFLKYSVGTDPSKNPARSLTFAGGDDAQARFPSSEAHTRSSKNLANLEFELSAGFFPAVPLFNLPGFSRNVYLLYLFCICFVACICFYPTLPAVSTAVSRFLRYSFYSSEKETLHWSGPCASQTKESAVKHGLGRPRLPLKFVLFF